MSPRSTAATKAAQRLWAHEAGKSEESEAVTSAAERVCARLRVELSRWIGADGYRALLRRALALTRPEFPALTGLSCEGRDGPELASAVRTHGAADVKGSVVAVVATLIDLLSRIVGEEMATRLVEQSGAPSPVKAPVTETDGGGNG